MERVLVHQAIQHAFVTIAGVEFAVLDTHVRNNRYNIMITLQQF